MSGSTISPVRPTGRRPAPRFYRHVAIACAVVVVVGFGPSFYFKPIVAAPPLDWLRVLHGLVFTAWIGLFVAQPTLVAQGRTDIHRRLGFAGAALAAGMVALGLVTAIEAAHRGATPLTHLAIPFFAIATFAGLVGAAVSLRRNAEAHKRLMLMATVVILGAAFARLPLTAAQVPPVFFVLTDLFLLVGVAYDLRTRGRVHPAYVWGGLFILASQPLQLAVMDTEAWLGFARWLVG